MFARSPLSLGGSDYGGPRGQSGQSRRCAHCRCSSVPMPTVQRPWAPHRPKHNCTGVFCVGVGVLLVLFYFTFTHKCMQFKNRGHLWRADGHLISSAPCGATNFPCTFKHSRSPTDCGQPLYITKSHATLQENPINQLEYHTRVTVESRVLSAENWRNLPRSPSIKGLHFQVARAGEA